LRHFDVAHQEERVAERAYDLLEVLAPHRQALVDKFPSEEQAMVAAALLDLQLRVDIPDEEERGAGR
jgi:hypothetical protein